MIKPLTPEELGILFQEIEFEPTGKLSELAKVAGLNLAVDYVGVDLSGENLSEDDLAGVNFSGSNLSNVNFKNTKLTNSNLSMAILIDANLQGANLSGADLSGADLSGADLSGADLSDANLQGVNLNKANLNSLNLKGANLSGADLSGADLSGANFIAGQIQGANFRGANLSNAYFIGVDFKEANFSEANLSGITFDLDITENFCTQDSRVQVSLNVVVNAKIANLIDIKDYPFQEIGIKYLMKKSIIITVRQYLNQIKADRFYMRFYEPTAGEISVEQQLKDVITKVLEERFGAIVIRVVPIPEQTDIIDYLQRLIGMVGSFNCEVLSLTGGEAVKLLGEFKILGIEQGSWYIFQSAFQPMRESQQELLKELKALKNQYSKVVSSGDIEYNREELDEVSQRIRAIENEVFGMDNIKRSIEKSVNAKLTTIDSEILKYTDNKFLSTMENFVNQLARESVIKQYGLEIEITNFYRTRTEGEKYLFNAKTQLERAKIDEALAQVEARTQQRQNQLEMSSRRNKAKSYELNKLYEGWARLIADTNVDPDELDYLNEKIDHLEKEILSLSLEDAGSALNILEPKRDRGKNSLRFKEQVGLLPNIKNLDSDSSNDTSTPN